MKGSMVCFEFENLSRIVDGRIDFQRMTDDRSIAEESRTISSRVGRDALHAKPIIRFSKSGLLTKNGFPTQSRLIDL